MPGSKTTPGPAGARVTHPSAPEFITLLQLNGWPIRSPTDASQNRYPGARCDSDSYIYCFTWDKQLLQEWEWSAEASAEWCDAHPNSYPPTILHVTDGQSTDGACASSRRGGRCCPGSPVPCALRVLRDGGKTRANCARSRESPQATCHGTHEDLPPD